MIGHINPAIKIRILIACTGRGRAKDEEVVLGSEGCKETRVELGRLNSNGRGEAPGSDAALAAGTNSASVSPTEGKQGTKAEE